MGLTCEVIVVGAGPIGLLTALLLEKLGHSVVVFERHSHRYAVPRTVGVFHQSVRILGSVDLFDTLVNRDAIYDLDGPELAATFVNAAGEGLFQLPLNGPSKSGVTQTFLIHQPTVEGIMEETCMQRGIKVVRSSEVIGVTQKGDLVEVAVHDYMAGENPTTKIFQASFVVGCDGAKSIVRQCAGLRLHQHAPALSRWLVVDVVPIPPNRCQQWKDFHNPKQYLDYRRPRTSVPSQPGRRRWEFMLLSHEASEEAETDAFIWNLLAEFGCSPVNAVIERRTVYSIAGAWAESFHSGRIALAGDAAHIAPQFLGQGLNSGFRDAKSLAWRLHLALRHTGSDWSQALNDYSSEQLGTTKIFVASAKHMEALLTITDREKAAMRDVALLSQSDLSFPDLERVASPGMHLREEQAPYGPSAEPGTLFMHDQVERDGKIDFCDKMLKPGWILLSHEPLNLQQLLTRTTYDRFQNLLDGQSVHFSPHKGGYRDVSGRYGEWFKENAVLAVLVRPDYYIYGTVNAPHHCERLIQRAVDHLFPLKPE